MSNLEKIQKLKEENEAMRNTMGENGVSSWGIIEEMIEDNLKEIKELEDSSKY